MKISIENFKSIRQVHEFEIKPMTILSGVNSSGKSSLIQMLLLIKQTLDKSSTKEVLDIKGAFFQATNFQDIIHKKDQTTSLNFELILRKDEIKLPSILFEYDNVLLTAHFCMVDEKLCLSKFEVVLNSETQEITKKFSITNTHPTKYLIDADSEFFGKNLMNKEIEANIEFVSIFPTNWKQVGVKKEDPEISGVFTIGWLKDEIDKVFQSVFYIGPAREKPKEIYVSTTQNEYVGINGQYAAQILHDQANIAIDYYIIDETKEGFNYDLKKADILTAANYWLCDYLQVGGKIFAKKHSDNFQIYLENDQGLAVNIRHVGYGISQVLPIIIQGLLMPKNSILIIEQPEIHLHPKLQSKLYDYLYCLTLQNKKVIVETHSSHFITRMRRRIAEDLSNEMDNKINMTFIENGLFRHLEFDDYGTLKNYHPKDFIEEPQGEYRAIIKAQMIKKKVKVDQVGELLTNQSLT